MRQNRRRICDAPGCMARLPSGSIDRFCAPCTDAQAEAAARAAQQARHKRSVTVRTVGSCSAGVEETHISLPAEPAWREIAI